MSAVLDGWARLVTGRRSAWAVIAGWVLLLVVAAPLAAGLGDTQRTDPVNYLPAGAQSTALLQELAATPGGDMSPAVVIYTRTGGLTPTDRTRITADRAAVRAHVTHAGQAGPVQVSADGAAALFTVELPSKDAVLNVAVPQLRDLTATAAGNSVGAPTAGGLSVAVTGPAGYTADANHAAAGIDGTLLIAAAAAAVVVVLLLLIYRSPLLWLLPILTVTGGLLTAQAAITLLARHGALTVTDLAAGILNVLVFGAATDYALLLIARYREQLHTTPDHRRALAAAVRSATPAIAASAGTVIAGMLCLLAATITANRGLGPVAALGIAGGLLASLTLLPALLAVTGRRVFWPPTPPTPQAPPFCRGRSTIRQHSRHRRWGCGHGSRRRSAATPGECGSSPRCCSPSAWSACSTPASACRRPAPSAAPSSPSPASSYSTRISHRAPAAPPRSSPTPPRPPASAALSPPPPASSRSPPPRPPRTESCYKPPSPTRRTAPPPRTPSRSCATASPPSRPRTPWSAAPPPSNSTSPAAPPTTGPSSCPSCWPWSCSC